MKPYRAPIRWNKVRLFDGRYNAIILSKQKFEDRQHPYLLVIKDTGTEIIVRYPDATSDRIDKCFVDGRYTLCPLDKEYWEDFTPAMQKQQFYNDAYNHLCESYGFVSDHRYAQENTTEPQSVACTQPVAEPYYASETNPIPKITSRKLQAYTHMRDAIDELIALAEEEIHCK